MPKTAINKTLVFFIVLRRKTVTWLKLPRREQLWILLLYPLSAVARTATLYIPFQYLVRYLGVHYKNTQLSTVVTKDQLQTACRIGRITKATARLTPWESKCFVQAIMTKTLLSLYGIPYVIYFGVSKTDVGDSNSDCTNNIINSEPEMFHIAAHCWIKVGAQAVIGREGHKNFFVLASVVSPVLLEFS